MLFKYIKLENPCQCFLRNFNTIYLLQSHYLFFLFLNTSAANNTTTPNDAVATELRPVLGNFLSLLATLAFPATFSPDLTLAFSTPYT